MLYPAINGSFTYKLPSSPARPLPTLRKIAAVFGMRIELNFVPSAKEQRKVTR